MKEELFTIFMVDAAEAEEIRREAIEPHRHDFEELLIGVEGGLEHFIDFSSQHFDAPFISFITRGKVHRLQPLATNGKCRIWALRFNSDFIPETIFQLYASFHNKANICMPFNGCFKRLDTLCQLIKEEYNLERPNLTIIRQLLSTLIVIIEAEQRKQGDVIEDSTSNAQNITFRNFLRLLDEHFREPREVNFYAERLFMTVRNLNIICQNILHQSVSEIIETRKLTEAKNLLLTTQKTIAEIGDELGYNEKAYFTHAFKRKAGITPSAFRKEMKNYIS